MEFVSGKDEQYAWSEAKVSAALTPEQREILTNRGVLSPKEIHRLADKTRARVAGPRRRQARLSQRRRQRRDR